MQFGQIDDSRMFVKESIAWNMAWFALAIQHDSDESIRAFIDKMNCKRLLQVDGHVDKTPLATLSAIGTFGDMASGE